LAILTVSKVTAPFDAAAPLASMATKSSALTLISLIHLSVNEPVFGTVIVFCTSSFWVLSLDSPWIIKA